MEQAGWLTVHLLESTSTFDGSLSGVGISELVGIGELCQLRVGSGGDTF